MAAWSGKWCLWPVFCLVKFNLWALRITFLFLPFLTFIEESLWCWISQMRELWQYLVALSIVCWYRSIGLVVSKIVKQSTWWLTVRLTSSNLLSQVWQPGNVLCSQIEVCGCVCVCVSVCDWTVRGPWESPCTWGDASWHWPWLVAGEWRFPLFVVFTLCLLPAYGEPGAQVPGNTRKIPLHPSISDFPPTANIPTNESRAILLHQSWLFKI